MLLTTALELLGFTDLQDIDHAILYDMVVAELFTPGLKHPEKNKILKYGRYLIVTLTKKNVMLVDDCEKVREILKKNCFYCNGGYAKSNAGIFHRFLLNPSASFEVDHFNRIKTDNRSENLRTVTRSENMKNKSRYKTNKTGVPGVTYVSSYKGYRARISHDGGRDSKFFSCKKYGDDEAYRLACEWRQQRKQELGYLGE